MNSNSESLSNFRPATAETINLIRRFNAEKRTIFLTSSNYIHAGTAKLGYLLSYWLARGAGNTGYYHTLFLNSGLEALSGAIKLARHTSVRRRKEDRGRILVLDERERLAPFFDPTVRGSDNSLTPQIIFAASICDAQKQVDCQRWSALVLVRYPGQDNSTALENLLALARRRGAMLIACATELEVTDPHLMKHGFAPDVTVFGENLTGYQLPFGCFTMTGKAYSVWNNNIDCFAQASTFGGNGVCVASVLDVMDRSHYVLANHRVVFDAIDSGRATMIEYWARYVNPRLAVLAKTYAIDLDVRQAWAGRLRFSDGREVIDCCGGFGSNLRGHNPPDVADVLAQHDPSHDYFSDLERLLASLSNFPCAFPAVSGATAVDLAVSLGMLANPTRTKIVSFVGNFSGKTLFGLNLSKYGPQRTASDEEAFRPYYTELVYVDPFAKNAEAELTRVLRGGDVALVWFEIIHGLMCESLPSRILSIIDALKEEGGYLVGLDEVLTGGWRASEKYLAHDGVVVGCDIVAVGKTLSDMTLPIAAVLVTEAVHRRASDTNSSHVQRLRAHYRNQLSAHIALNALSSLQPDDFATLIRNRRVIEKGLREVVSNSKVLTDVRGCGSLLRLQLNAKYFPFRDRSAMKVLLEMALSHLIFVRAGIFVFLLRFLHRVFTTDTDALDLVQRLSRALHGITPWMLYRYTLSRILAQRLPRLALLLGPGITVVPAPNDEVNRSPPNHGDH
jgi:acetylornithine/succinyldiaminopimelate/putrescine aminotransferase